MASTHAWLAAATAAVAAVAVEAVGRHAPRVSTVVKVDWRPSVTGAMTGKVESVERHLGAPATG